MQVSAIKNQYNNYIKQNYNQKKITDKVSFGNEKSITWDYLYEKSLVKHKYDIAALNPKDVEKYFDNQGIPAMFRKGKDETRKFVAFCCLKAAGIFKFLNYTLPTKVMMDYYDEGDILGSCYWGPNREKDFPVRTVVFNANIDLDSMIDIKKDDYHTNFSTSKHFIQTFLHEFGHSLHFHHLYSRWGCPYLNQGYEYNPNTINKMRILNMPVNDSNGNPIKNPFIDTTVHSALEESSRYGGTLLPEAFAEEFAKTIIDDMDLFTLQLNDNPFPMRLSPTLNAVLQETWEGLVDDDEGFIRN